MGVSKIVRSGLAAENTRVGTPLYLAPELVKQKPYDYKIDVWALGCILYQMCSGKAPFSGENLISLGYNIVHNQPSALPSSFSSELLDLVAKLLEKNPSIRPASHEALGFIMAAKSALRQSLLKPISRSILEGHLDSRGVVAGPGLESLVDNIKVSKEEARNGLSPNSRRSPRRPAPAVLNKNKGTSRAYIGSAATDTKNIIEDIARPDTKGPSHPVQDKPSSIILQTASSGKDNIPAILSKTPNKQQAAATPVAFHVEIQNRSTKPAEVFPNDANVLLSREITPRNIPELHSHLPLTSIEECHNPQPLFKDRYENVSPVQQLVAQQAHASLSGQRKSMPVEARDSSKTGLLLDKHQSPADRSRPSSGLGNRPRSAVLGPRVVPGRPISNQDKVRCTEMLLRRAMVADPVHHIIKNRMKGGNASVSALDGVDKSSKKSDVESVAEALVKDSNTQKNNFNYNQLSSNAANDIKQRTSFSNLQTSAIDMSYKNRLAQANTGIHTVEESSSTKQPVPVALSFHPFLDPFRQIFKMGAGKVEHPTASQPVDEYSEARFQHRKEQYRPRQRPQTASANLQGSNQPAEMDMAGDGGQYRRVARDVLALENKRNYRIKTATASGKKEQAGGMLSSQQSYHLQAQPSSLYSADFVFASPKATIHDL